MSSTSAPSSGSSYIPLTYFSQKRSEIVPYLKSIFSVLTMALITLIFARSVDRVLYTRLSIEYLPYNWLLSNLILPIAFLM